MTGRRGTCVMARGRLSALPDGHGGRQFWSGFGFTSRRRWLRRSTRRAWTMKHITGTALAVACFAAVGAALFAGKDDIRKFRRILSM
jgi:hypothetical protein